MALTWSVAIDFDNDGSFGAPGDDISAYVKDVQIRLGLDAGSGQTAQAGSCQIVVNNADRRFSPAYAGGPYAGKLLPRRPIRVQASDGLTTWTLFRGFTRAFRPSSGAYLARECVIEAVDTIAILQGYGLDMPLQQGQTGDLLIRAAVNFALGAPAASATITFGGNPADGDTVTIHGTLYRFKTTLTGAAYEVLIGGSDAITAQYLTDAINTADGIGVTYGSGTLRLGIASAALSGNVVTLTAMLPGAIGNSYTLVKSSAALSISGATFSGGADYPASPAPSYETGKTSFDYAGDTWAQTDIRTVIDDITRSEWGLCWAARDGTILWKNRDHLFSRVAAAPALALDSQPYAEGEQTDEDIYNSVQVRYVPRATLSSGVIAKATSVIQAPGQSGKERWNGTVVLPGGGAVIVKLPFTDPATGQPMGALSLMTPLTPTTDWTANEARDGSGPDYTGNANLSFSMVVNGGACEVSIKNTALGPLYVTKLQVRGVGLVRYHPITVASEDATSQSTYLKRVLEVDLPLPVDQNFAAALADYLLGRYKDAYFRVRCLDFGAMQSVGGVVLFSLEIGDVITLSDHQMGLSGAKYLIAGVEYGLKPGGVSQITFNVRRLDDVTYWILEDSTYGALGVTSRAGI